MSTRMLNEITKSLTQNGLRAAVFANSDGLILSSSKSAEVNEKIIAAMIALLSDAAEKTKDELDLKGDLQEMKLKYSDAAILCRQMNIEGSFFLLAARCFSLCSMPSQFRNPQFEIRNHLSAVLCPLFFFVDVCHVIGLLC